MTTSSIPGAVRQAAQESQPRQVKQRTRLGESKIKVYGPPVLALVIIIVLWYVIAAYLASIGRTTILPSPTSILVDSFFPSDPRDKPITGALLRGLGLSTGVALAGLAISIVIGIGWAVLMSQARWVERSLFPYAVMLQCIPILALVPLIGSSLGYALNSRVLVCVLISLFPMVSNTLFGLQAADRSQRELFQLQGASRWTVLTKLQFPGAMPAIFAGMRISAGLAVIGAIVGDFFFRRGQAGLGVLINNYASRLQTAELWAAVLTASLLGVLIFLVFGWIGKLAVGRWYEPAG